MYKSKIHNLNTIEKTVAFHKDNGLKVGFVSGCFDVVHIGHISLFQFAKSKTDILIVGIDSDDSIKLSKGGNRPINKQKTRIEFLSHIALVDYILPLDYLGTFGDSFAEEFWQGLYQKVNPSAIITSAYADKFAKSKKDTAKKLNIEFFPFDNLYNISTTSIEMLFSEQ